MLTTNAAYASPGTGEGTANTAHSATPRLMPIGCESILSLFIAEPCSITTRT
jgi:hypothetical protein